MTNRIAVSLAACGACVLGSAAFATPWNNPNGSGNFFTWQNGGTDNGLFGSPQLIGGNTFLFSPIGFIASADDGATDTKSDRLYFDLHASAGFSISAIQIIEVGTYTVDSGGSSADVNGALSVDDLDSGGTRSEGAPVQYSPVPPYGFGTGPYQGSVLADLSAGQPWTNVHVEFTTNLIAISVPGSSATITLDVTGSQVAINIVPAPAGAAAMGLGLLAMGRRRRA
ncbi:MAG: hypothetical protein H6811_03305 [Phycisphaeraceae bacterium]|nr:hypothetical protein [Phycisphaeraceae bacterium]